VDAKETIKKIICELTRVDTIDDRVNLIEDGVLDSFQIMNLIVALEKEFGVKIPGVKVSAETFGNMESIARLLQELGTK
jgi:acyl carrier protein